MLASRRSGHAVRHLALMYAVVAAATVAGTAATPAVADHEAPAVSATLAGSLQSELGCPDDWSPRVAATALQPRRRRPGRSRSTCRRARGSGRSRSTARGTAATRRPTSRSCWRTRSRLTFTYDDTTHRVAVGPADRPAASTDADRAAGRHHAARGPDPRAVLLRDGRPVRQRRPDQRHRRDRRRPAGDRLRPDRQGLLPRRRHRRPDRRSSTTSRASARPRSG